MDQSIRIRFSRGLVTFFVILIIFIIGISLFSITRISHKSLSETHLFIILSVTLIPLIVILVAFLTIFNVNIVVNNDMIEIKSYIYREKIIRNEIEEIHETENLTNDYLISYRISGYNFFGTSFGWFKLVNGNKAFLLVNKNNYGKYLIIKTKDGKTYILSGDFLENLHNLLNLYSFNIS